MHTHQLLDHPLFEERPIKKVLEPFGFEINIHAIEATCEDQGDDLCSIDAYADDPQDYIDSLEFPHPAGFTEIYRAEDEDGDIISVAVRAKTVFADSLLYADPAFYPGPELTQAVFDVISERFRQVDDEDWTAEHDDDWQRGELSAAAASYAYKAIYSRVRMEDPPIIWPFDEGWWKPTDPRRDLVKAGALILAEIERLDRAAERQADGCKACGSTPGQHHSPECSAVNAFTAGRIPPSQNAERQGGEG